LRNPVLKGNIKWKNVSGVPVLFIPGNAGSYKQVRSIASESHRLFNNMKEVYDSDMPDKVQFFFENF
jgi:glycosylphosphatidylinositol deacylase